MAKGVQADYGAAGDGSTNDTTAVNNALAANMSSLLVFEAGTYLVDNPITVNGYSGTMRFDGGATLLFTDNAAGGLFILGGSHAHLVNPRTRYQVTPPSRISGQDAILVSPNHGVRIDNPDISESPATGILIRSSEEPQVRDPLIRATNADGIHIVTCTRGFTENADIADTGDDGLAILSLNVHPDRRGHTARNIKVADGLGRGIAVIGQSDVLIDGFEINGTSLNGIMVDTDGGVVDSRRPVNVTVRNGYVYGAGTVVGQSGNEFGLSVEEATNVNFDNILVDAPTERGLSVFGSDGVLSFDNIEVLNTGGSFDGCNLFQNTGVVQISNFRSQTTGGAGFLAIDCSRVEAENISVYDSATVAALKRAIWLEDIGELDFSGGFIQQTQGTYARTLFYRNIDEGHIRGIVRNANNTDGVFIDGDGSAIDVALTGYIA